MNNQYTKTEQNEKRNHRSETGDEKGRIKSKLTDLRGRIDEEEEPESANAGTNDESTDRRSELQEDEEEQEEDGGHG